MTEERMREIRFYAAKGMMEQSPDFRNVEFFAAQRAIDKVIDDWMETGQADYIYSFAAQWWEANKNDYL